MAQENARVARRAASEVITTGGEMSTATLKDTTGMLSATGTGVSGSITDVSLSETGSTSTETFTVTLTDANGLLSASGKGITGSGTTTLTITGKLSQVNKDLARLKDTDSVSGGDTITINATDSLGGAATPTSIAVTVNPPAAMVPPPAAEPEFWRRALAVGGRHAAMA